MNKDIWKIIGESTSDGRKANPTIAKGIELLEEQDIEDEAPWPELLLNHINTATPRKGGTCGCFP